MVSFHSLIGIGEAVITGTVISVILQQRPDLIYGVDLRSSASETNRFATGISEAGRFIVCGLVVALAIAAFASPFASEYSDGLEAVAERQGITASETAVGGLFADYDGIPLGDWKGLSVSIAGIGGSLVVFAAAMLIGRVRRDPVLVTE